MNIENATKLLEVLADQQRLTIVKELLKENRLIGTDLLKLVSCGQSTLSHHMSLLSDSKLVFAKKKGNKTYYSVNKDLYSSLIKYLLKNVSSNNQFIMEKADLLEDTFEDKKDSKEEVPIYLL